MLFSGYSSSQIKRAVIQILESIHLVENSKKSKIVISRFYFLLKTILFLENNSGNSRYLTDIREGLSFYRNAYSDRVPSKIAFAILQLPNTKLCNELYCISLYNSLGRQLIDYVEVFKTLQKENAKIKRKEKILDALVLIKKEIKERCREAKSYQKILEATNALENTIRTRVNFDDLKIKVE